MLPDVAQRIPVPPELALLVTELSARLAPMSIWLFGSRARGDNRPDSDWDILVGLPDDSPALSFDPLTAWDIARRSGVRATILTVAASDLAESWGVPNTLGYPLAREGRLLDV